MLKFFGSAPADQTTPKATPATERNPFDFLTSPARKGSIASLVGGAAGSSGTRTPTIKHSGNLSFSRPPPIPTATYFGPGDVTPGAAVTQGGVPTTAVSIAEPDFSFTTQPSSLARKKDSPTVSNSSGASSSSATAATTTGTTLTPKGKLSVKLISARALSAPSPHSRPYVVVTFDQNEFVSREPIHEEAEEATGVAIQREEGATASPRAQSNSHSPAARSTSPPLRSPTSAAAAATATASKEPSSESSTTNSSNSTLSGLSKTLEAFKIGSSSTGGGGGTPPTPRGQSPSGGPITGAGALGRVGEDVKSGQNTPTARRSPDTSGASSPSLLVSAYNPTWKHEVFFDVMNEKSMVQVQIFDRSIEEERFLGLAEIRPRLVSGHVVDQWFPLSPRADERVTGEIRIQIRYEKFDTKKGLAVNDFDFLRMVGKGTFGRVFQVRKKDTKRIYAMKVLSKREIVAKKEVAHTIGERKILQRSSESPFLLGLKFSFQSETDLYLIMDYKSGGELFHHLQKEGRFTEDRARFYTAEIVLAFEHLHKFDIVYRDLKPENILLDATGHIVLCDFGLSKPDLPSDALTNTFCGTTEYLAPEILLDDQGYSKLVDFWSLGVLLFEMCCGWSPFYAEDTQQMYKLICFGKVKFPRGVIGEDGKQFVKGLLNRNPKHRLGAINDAAELKEHAFFSSIDWDALAARQIAPPFKPYVESDDSVANFDPEFTEANLMEEAPEDVIFDEDDPSADWLDKPTTNGNRTTTVAGTNPVRPALTTVLSTGPVDIRQRKAAAVSDPLTNSVQENFRGFTFVGEGESLIHNAGSGLYTDKDREELADE